MLIVLALLPACLPELPDDPKVDTASDTADTGPAGSAPVVSNVRLDPADPRTNDVVGVTFDAEDPDGDTLFTAITWTVNGARVEGQTGAELDGAAWFDRDDVVGVTVSVSDGSRATEASASVGVVNTAPSAPGVAITPAEPTDDDALACAVVTESVDPDGDTVTYAYAWTVDGVDAGVSGPSVDAARTGAGETWACSVTGSDGSATGEAGTASVSVAAAPTCGDGSVTHTASGVDFVTVCAQTFEMGCTAGAAPCLSDETLHTVTLTNDYYVGRTEVTQGQFRAVMGYNPSGFTSCGDDCPVENLSWHESAAYTNAVSNAAGLANCYTCTGSGASVTCDTAGNPYTCEGYRLLTESEWEAAARCGTDFTYAGSNTIGDVAWYDGNSGGLTHAVAGKYPNACGIYDMTGNVAEWNGDWYDVYGGTATDPVGSASGAKRVLRGGGWGNYPRSARGGHRSSFDPANRNDDGGLRLARTAP